MNDTATDENGISVKASILRYIHTVSLHRRDVTTRDCVNDCIPLIGQSKTRTSGGGSNRMIRRVT